MELQMDAEEIARALARSQVSSDRVFGAVTLEPAGCGDRVPRSAFFPGPVLGPSQEELLRAAHGRLLGGGGFPHVLDLFCTSGGLVPPGTDLTAPSLAAELPRGSRPGLEVARALGEQPRLPFDDASFDAALVTLEVGSLRKPLEVLREVGRVLRSQGLVAVSFGEARYDGAQTRLWAHSADREHLMLAEAFLEFSGARFCRPTALTLFRGPQGLEWHEGSQPPEQPGSARVHLVLAYRDAVPPLHLASPPFPRPPPPPAKTSADVRFDAAGRPRCPYCGERMGRYAPPVTVFEIDYGVDELYVCFNDRCQYYRGSRRCMRSQGHPGFTYRFSLNPETGATGPLLDDLWGGLRSCKID
jgi:SAM-dependent methyltransferase